jgi:hypothetical protein
MNLATLVQSQNLATLLQALAPVAELAAGKTVEARLLSLAGDGTATAQVADTKISLVLAGPEAKQAALRPGATLLLRIDAPEEAGTGLRATLLEVRPPAATAAPPRTAPLVDTPAPSPTAMAGTPMPATAGHGPAAMLPAAPRGPLAQPLAVMPPVTSPASAEASAAALPATTLPTAATARALAGPLLGTALARQDSLAPLFANLRGLAEGSISFVLPKPLLAAIDRVLAQAVPAERRTVTARVLREAVQGSGLFLEARQANGQPAPVRGDLKAALLGLRETLVPLIETLSPYPGVAARQAEAEPPAQAGQEQQNRPAPPRRDGPLLPQAIAEPTLAAGEKPLAVAWTLLDQSDAALDRITLAQYASLPQEAARTEPGQAQRWLTEIPLAFHQGAAILPLQIEKEPPRRDADGATPPLWRIRFALDVEPMGPLQGVVTLQGRSVGVTLWAEREETSRLLRGATPGLEAALADAQFENGTIDIHTGQPRVLQPTAGQFLDRMS